MKTTNLITILASASFWLVSCKQKPEQDPEINSSEEVSQQQKNAPEAGDASFVDRMTGKVFQNYLHVKTALVKSDLEEAKIAAANLAETFASDRPKLKVNAEAMATSQDLPQFREHFDSFTIQVEPLLRDSLKAGAFYKQFCPMAFNNRGASWFSDVPEIRNPYFGSQMLTCGRIETTITKN